MNFEGVSGTINPVSNHINTQRKGKDTKRKGNDNKTNDNKYEIITWEDPSYWQGGCQFNADDVKQCENKLNIL